MIHMRVGSTIKHLIITAGMLLCVAVLVFGVSFRAFAQTAPTPNVFGQGWGVSAPSAGAPLNTTGGIGWVNFFNSTVPYGVHFDPVTGKLSGQAWSEKYGWIDFNLSHPQQQCGNPASATARVDMNAVMANGSAPFVGYAHVYSAGAGDQFWNGCIKMSGNYQSGSGSYGVEYILMNNGTSAIINGFAWGDEVVGWVQFRKLETVAPQNPDVCPNLPGTQATVPVNMVLDGGNCKTQRCPVDPGFDPVMNVANISMCKTYCPTDPNFDPTIHIPDPNLCIDVCPNIPNMQAVVPPNLVLVNGECVKQGQQPYCPLLPGFNLAIHTADNSLCKYVCPNDPWFDPALHVPDTTLCKDVCPNIPGDQTSIPAGYYIDANGLCKTKTPPPPSVPVIPIFNEI